MRFRETVTRRNLPHWYLPGAAHFVTYRLRGSLPQSVLMEMHSRKEALLKRKPPPGALTAQYREQIHKQLFAIFDQSLDQQHDECLRDPRIAAIIRSNLHHHNGSKYHLMAYCVMPNHVHVLFQPLDVATGGPPVGRDSGKSRPKSSTLHQASVGGPPVGRDSRKSTGEPPVATIVGEQADVQSPLARIMHSLKSYTAHRANEILERSGTFWQAESYDHWVRDDDELERIVDYIRANPVKAGLAERPQDWFWSSCHDRYLLDGDLCAWLVATGGPPV